MCGIAGYFGNRPLEIGRRRTCLKLMQKRGPDGHREVEIRDRGQRYIHLLHSRLSIIDLNERASQPMQRDDLTLTFNGEIYNYVELREELKALGHSFKTTGDAEVILAAYRQWGTSCSEHFEGMWAFALHDAAKNQLFLSRDRFGEKPLYYWYDQGHFYFGSEVRFLMGLAGKKPELNIKHLQRFLVNGYKSLFPSGEDYFHGIKMMPAGSNIILNEPNEPKPVFYWNISYSPIKMSRRDAEEGAQEYIEKALKLRLRADVPIALRLSGGIDSNVALGTAIHKLNKDIHCFSVVEDDHRYNETKSILDAVDYHGCAHEIIEIPKENFMERLYGLIDYFGKPMLTISYYLHALVSERIADKGYKVSLGGTGADEIFSGYYDHYLFWLAEVQNRPDFDRLKEGWRQTYGQFVRNPYLQDPEVFVKNPNVRDHIFLGADKFADFLHEPFAESHKEYQYTEAILRNRMLNELYSETVPIMLHEDDLSSMAYSVENRAVYLDSELIKFLSTVPSEHLFHNKLPKHLLRQAGAGIIPEEIRMNPRKQGINAPVTSFVDFKSDDIQEMLLDDSQLYDIVNRDKVTKLLRSNIELNSESKFLFSLISAKMFLDSHNNFQL